MMGLTPNLALTASAIAETTEALGRAPSAAELAHEMDMSRGQIAFHLDRLVERGWLPAHTGRGRRVLVLRHAAPPPPDECLVALTDEGRVWAERERLAGGEPGGPRHG